MHFDVIIIGAGPVGLFAAFQAGMLGMKSAVVDTLDFIGGQCSALYPEKPIYDIPGYSKITAHQLIDNLKAQASTFHPSYFLSQRVELVKNTNDLFEIHTSDNNVLFAKAIVIAAGAGAFSPNRPPIDSIESYERTSVFYNVTRIDDFEKKNIVIAGGGDSAIDWAINLSKVANKIYLVHRRDKFRAAPALMDEIKTLASNGKIEIIVPYQLSSIQGKNGQLERVIVESLNGDIRELEAEVLLPFFGLKMSLGPILNWGLNIHNHHIEVDPIYYQTNIDGIYAVGDAASYQGKLKLILTGFAEAASALHHVYPRVFDGKTLHFQYSTNRGLPS